MRKIILASAIAAAALCGCSLEDAATSQETEATTVVEIDNIATESGVEKEASQSLETDGENDTGDVEAEAGADAWSLLNGVSDDESGNKLFSKTSLDSVLALVGMGMDSEAGMKDIEAFTGLELTEKSLKDYQASLNTESVKSANGMFVSDQFVVDPDFSVLAEGLGMTAENYGSAAEGMDLINAFVNSNTDGMIPKLVESEQDVKDVALVNTLYFNDLWDFEWTDETTAPFYADGAEKDATFLAKTFDSYYENDDWYGMKFAYKDGGYAMYAAIPKDGSMNPSITEKEFEDLFAAPIRSEANVFFPTFEYETSMDLTSLVREKCPGVFESLSILQGKDVVVDTIMQKAKIEVTKEGTRASAATGAMIRTTAAVIEPPAEIHFDHPFLFAIADEGTGEDLFVGLMADPA